MGSDTPWVLAILRSRAYEAVRQVGPAVVFALAAFQLLAAPFVLNIPFPQFIRQVSRYVGWAALIEQEKLDPTHYTGLFYALVSVTAVAQAYRLPSQYLLRWLRGGTLLVMASAAALSSVLFVPALRLAVAGFVCDSEAGLSWMRALPGTLCDSSSGAFVATVVLASLIVCGATANAIFFTSSSSSDLYAKARQHDLSLMALRSEAHYFPLVVVAAQAGVALCLVFLPPASLEDSRIGSSVLTGILTSLLIVALRTQPFQHHGTNRWVAVTLASTATTALASFVVALLYGGTPAARADGDNETPAWFTLIVLLLLLPAQGVLTYRRVALAQANVLRRLVHARASRGAAAGGSDVSVPGGADAGRVTVSWWAAVKAGFGRFLSAVSGDPKYAAAAAAALPGKLSQDFGTGTSHRSAILLQERQRAAGSQLPGSHSSSLAPSSAGVRSASAALAGSIVDLRESLVGCSQSHFYALHTELAAASRIAAVLLASNHLRASSLRLVLSALTSNPIRILHTLDLSGNPFAFYEEDEATPPSTFTEGVVRYVLPPEPEALGTAAAGALAASTASSNTAVHAGLVAALRSLVGSRGSRRSSATVAPLTAPSPSRSPASVASSHASSAVSANGSMAGTPAVALQTGPSTSHMLTEHGSVPQLVAPSNSFAVTIPNAGSAGALAATQGAGSALGGTTPAVAVLLERLAAATGPSPLSPPWTRPYTGPAAPVRITGLVPALLCSTSLRVLVLDGCIIRASTMRALCDAMGEVMLQGAERDESAAGSSVLHSGGARAGRHTSSSGSAFFETELDSQGATTEQGSFTRSAAGGGGNGGGGGSSSSIAARPGRPSIARPGIRTLSMWGCSLTPEALVPLAALLAKTGTCTIEHLNISGNWMGPNAAPIVAAALRNNHVICSCDLTWNNLGVEGVRTVMSALPHDGRYIEVKLHCNAVDHKALVTVKEALAATRAAAAAAAASKAAAFPGKSALRVLEAVQEVTTPAVHTGADGDSMQPSVNDFRAIDVPASPPADGATSLEDILRDPATGHQRSLFEYLGGEATIGAVVDTFYLYLVTDPLIGPRFFRHVTMSPMRAMQKDFIVQLTGGPSRYAGRDMFTAHRTLGITDDDFDAVCDHLVAALLYHAPALPAPVVAAIGGAVDSLRHEVVTRSVDGKPLSRRNRVSFTEGQAKA